MLQPNFHKTERHKEVRTEIKIEHFMLQKNKFNEQSVIFVMTNWHL